MPSLDFKGKKAVEEFLFTAWAGKRIDRDTYTNLNELLSEMSSQPSERAKAPEVETAVSASADAVDAALLSHAHASPRTKAALTPPEPDPNPRAPEPDPGSRVPSLQSEPQLQPKRRPERRIVVATRRRWESASNGDALAVLSRAWGRFIGDVLANVLLYVGVTLATVALFSFFAFGHFGRVITNPDARLLVFVAVPLVFAGMARLLRKQASVQFSADAIGVIAALTLPIMMAGTFRDGSNMIVPDVGGSARWAMYSIVGIICAGIFLRLSRGRIVYAYLVAPMIWVTVGALGLYATFGASSYQLYLVLAAMALTVVVVAIAPASPLSAASARVAAVASPVVLLAAIVFAFRNGDDPLGPSPAAAAAVTGFMLLALSMVDPVWSGRKTSPRDALRSVLRGGGYLALGLAAALAVSWLAAPTWIGPVLIIYAVVVWSIDQRLGSVGDWLPIATRLTVAGATLVSLPFTWPAIAVLSAVTIVGGLWLLGGRSREPIERFIGPSIDSKTVSALALWLPVALGVVGYSRLEYPAGAVLLLVTTSISVLARWTPEKAQRLRGYAGYPGLSLGVATLVYLLLYRPVASDGSIYAIVLLGVSAVVAMSTAPWAMRGWVVLAALFAGIFEAAPAGSGAEAVAVASLVVGAGLLAATQSTQFENEVLGNALYAHVLFVLAAGMSIASQTWSLVLIVGVVLTLTHVVETAFGERRTLRWIGAVGQQLPSERSAIEAVPTWLTSASFAVVLAGLWEITEIEILVASATSGWAVGVATLAFLGLANRFAARAMVYVFALAGAAIAITASQGWIATLIGALAVTVLFLMAQRELDLYLSIGGFGAAVTQMAATVWDGEAAFVVMAAFGASLLAGTSAWAIGTQSRELTVMRRPFVSVGAAMLAVGSIVLAVLSISPVADTSVNVLTAGLTILLAAAVMAFAGYVFRWRWSGAVVATALPIGYILSVWSVTDTPLHPLAVAPVIVALVVLASILPERRTLSPPASPASAMMVSAIVTSTAAGLIRIDAPYASISILTIAAVVAVARLLWSIESLGYVSAAIVLLAGGVESPEALLLAEVVVLAWVLWRETHKVGGSARVLRWVASALIISAVTSTIDVFNLPRLGSGVILLGAGLAVAVLSIVLVTTERAQNMVRWWPQCAVLGRVGALAGVAAIAVSSTHGILALAAWSGVEAAITARYAVHRSMEILAWMATTLAITTGLLITHAAAGPPVPTASMWWFVGSACLISWTTLMRRGTGKIWISALGAYAHLAIAMSAAVIVTESASSTTARLAVTVSLLAFAASWVSVALATQSQFLAAIGTTAAVASWCAATGSVDNPTNNFWRWIPAFAVAAVGWRLLAHASVNRRLIWERAAGVATASLFLAILASAIQFGARDSWIRAALILILGAVAVYDTPTMREWPLSGSDVARAMTVLAVWLLGGWYAPGDPASVVLLGLVTLAGTGIAIASATRSSDGPHRDTWLWLGMHAGAATSAVIVFGWPSAVSATVLLVFAGSALGYGVLSGSRRWSMAGVEGFVIVAAALAFSDGSIPLVSGTVVAALAVLIATETERIIAAARNEPLPDLIRVVEWLALLAVPLVTISAALEDLSYVLVLIGFGTVAMLWGILTRVRRRVFAGAVSFAAAIVLAVATPIAEAVAVGMANAGAIGITFGIGVLVIVVAIAIERYQHNVGTGLRRLTDAMADWS